MPPGPILIFDKSFLQGLSIDEAVWLDHFFLSNITPLFFVETLADLEKSVVRGRTPEDVVGNLATKTPDMQSHPNAHHQQLLSAELFGHQAISMDGRIHRAAGTSVMLGDQRGIVFKESDEEAALARWQAREFLDLERQIAKIWRRHAAQLDLASVCDGFKNWFLQFPKPMDLAEVKRFAEQRINEAPNPDAAFHLGLSLLSVGDDALRQITQRWVAAGRPPIKEFAPYFYYLYSVMLFYCLAVAADLISKVRPAGKAANLVDVMYLFYLPFCMVFTSSDRLHERIVPLFLRPDQSFVRGPELKAALSAIDGHFDQLPPEVKARGLYAFAGWPPDGLSFVMTTLFDKHVPAWRKRSDDVRDESPKMNKAIMELVRKFEMAQETDVGAVAQEKAEFMQVQRKVRAKKGKWMRVPPEAIANGGRDDNEPESPS